MTAPVLMKMPEDKRFWQAGVYKMGFLLPAEHQQNPPNPTDDSVSFSDVAPSFSPHCHDLVWIHSTYNSGR